MESGVIIIISFIWYIDCVRVAKPAWKLRFLSKMCLRTRIIRQTFTSATKSIFEMVCFFLAELDSWPSSFVANIYEKTARYFCNTHKISVRSLRGIWSNSEVHRIIRIFIVWASGAVINLIKFFCWIVPRCTHSPHMQIFHEFLQRDFVQQNEVLNSDFHLMCHFGCCVSLCWTRYVECCGSSLWYFFHMRLIRCNSMILAGVDFYFRWLASNEAVCSKVIQSHWHHRSSKISELNQYANSSSARNIQCWRSFCHTKQLFKLFDSLTIRM